MSEQPEFTLPKEFEDAIQVIFPRRLPDPAFVDRLGQQLSTQVNRHIEHRHKARTMVSPLAWGAIAVVFVLSLIWGINTLLPRTEPGKSTTPSPSPSPSPSASPTAQLPTLTTPSLEQAVFYTVEAGDSLATIADKTGVPMETIRDLNVFVLQANDLRAGLKILIGFKDQVPVFYTVHEGDTIVGICAKAGISVESFNLINRLGEQAAGSQDSTPAPLYILTPGIRVIIGLENLGINKNDPSDGDLVILTDSDLNCDDDQERLLGVETDEIEYFNISPQFSEIILEESSETGFTKVWQQTAQDAGAAYLAYRLFRAEGCNQFLVVLSHKGKEAVNVYRWNGEHMTSVLRLSGRFLFDGEWMSNVFGDYQKSPHTLYLGELQQATSTAKNIWILRGYQWIEGELKLIVERRIESAAGG